MNEASIKLSKGLRKIATEIDETLEDVSGERHGFLLLVFTEGRAQYVSNCNRKDTIEQMKHLLELWEQEMPDIEAHKVI